MYQEEVEHVKKVLAGNAQLFTKLGIKQIAIGLVTRKGDKSKRVGIICYVTKPPEAQAQGSEPIPSEIEGVPVEVIVIPEGFKPRPL